MNNATWRSLMGVVMLQSRRLLSVSPPGMTTGPELRMIYTATRLTLGCAGVVPYLLGLTVMLVAVVLPVLYAMLKRHSGDSLKHTR